MAQFQPTRGCLWCGGFGCGHCEKQKDPAVDLQYRIASEIRDFLNRIPRDALRGRPIAWMVTPAEYAELWREMSTSLEFVHLTILGVRIVVPR
jgi:hypothetical protein